MLANGPDELLSFGAELDDHFGAFLLLLFLLFLILVVGLLIWLLILLGIVLVMHLLRFLFLCMFGLLLLSLEYRFIAPCHHSLNSFLLVLFNLELIYIKSMGPLFTT